MNPVATPRPGSVRRATARERWMPVSRNATGRRLFSPINFSCVSIASPKDPESVGLRASLVTSVVPSSPFHSTSGPSIGLKVSVSSAFFPSFFAGEPTPGGREIRRWPIRMVDEGGAIARSRQSPCAVTLYKLPDSSWQAMSSSRRRGQLPTASPTSLGSATGIERPGARGPCGRGLEATVSRARTPHADLSSWRNRSREVAAKRCARFTGEEVR